MLLGRARNVARVPIGTRALLEAWEAGRRAQRVLEGRRRSSVALR